MFMKLGKFFLKNVIGFLILIMLGACAPSTKFQEEQNLQSSHLSGAPGIIGGQEVSPDESPAQTSVIVYDPIGKALCTGSLLGGNMVLTAAHCLGSDPRKLLVVFAMNIGKASKEMARSVVGAIAHPLWKTNKDKPKDNGDLAIIKYQGVTPTGYRAATLLPSASPLKNKSLVLLAGYGISDGIKKTGSGLLRQVMTTISNAQFSATEIQIEQRQGRGACHGDSGGPAYVISNGVYYLWGITSRGNQDGKDQCNMFSIYTNLLPHYKWMQDSVRLLAVNNIFDVPQSKIERMLGSGTYY